MKGNQKSVLRHSVTPIDVSTCTFVNSSEATAHVPADIVF